MASPNSSRWPSISSMVAPGPSPRRLPKLYGRVSPGLTPLWADILTRMSPMLTAPASSMSWSVTSSTGDDRLKLSRRISEPVTTISSISAWPASSAPRHIGTPIKSAAIACPSRRVNGCRARRADPATVGWAWWRRADYRSRIRFSSAAAKCRLSRLVVSVSHYYCATEWSVGQRTPMNKTRRSTAETTRGVRIVLSGSCSRPVDAERNRGWPIRSSCRRPPPHCPPRACRSVLVVHAGGLSGVERG